MQVHVTLTGYAQVPNPADSGPLKIDLDWTAADPCAITISPRDENGSAGEPWTVSRNLFYVAAKILARGSWVGYSDFSVCYGKGTAMLAFAPGRDRGKTTIVHLDPTALADFVDHTCRIIRPGSDDEANANLVWIDETIERILSDA